MNINFILYTINVLLLFNVFQFQIIIINRTKHSEKKRVRKFSINKHDRAPILNTQ